MKNIILFLVAVFTSALVFAGNGQYVCAAPATANVASVQTTLNALKCDTSLPISTVAADTYNLIICCVQE